MITTAVICVTALSFPLMHEHCWYSEKQSDVLVVLIHFFFCSQTADCEPGSEDDESLREMVELAAQRLYDALSPVYC